MALYMLAKGQCKNGVKVEYRDAEGRRRKRHVKHGQVIEDEDGAFDKWVGTVLDVVEKREDRYVRLSKKGRLPVATPVVPTSVVSLRSRPAPEAPVPVEPPVPVEDEVELLDGCPPSPEPVEDYAGIGEFVPEEPIPEEPTPEEPVPFERARNDEGEFVADDPETPDVDEAYVGGEGPEEPAATDGKEDFPFKAADWKKDKWVEQAELHGIELSPAETRLNKHDLVSLIRSRADDLDL